MRLVLYSCHTYEAPFLARQLSTLPLDISYKNAAISIESVENGPHTEIVSVFVNDVLDKVMLTTLANKGCRLILLRAAGYDKIDINTAAQLGINVCNVPEYSPQSIAEYALMLTLALLRKLPKTLTNMQQHQYALAGLVGQSLHGKTVGVIGTGRIGALYAQMLQPFNCTILACDPIPNALICMSNIDYVELEEIVAQADIISLHCPLTPATRHLFNKQQFVKMKSTASLINTSRGALVDSEALLAALQSKQIANYAGDVYEFEAGLYFPIPNAQQADNTLLDQLCKHDNCMMTPHCAFLTEEGLHNIAHSTFANCVRFMDDDKLVHQLTNDALNTDVYRN
jgi:D-lactate dehydrogenase